MPTSAPARSSLPGFDRWEAAFAPYATADAPGARSDRVVASASGKAIRTETPRVHHLLLAEAPATGLEERACGGALHFADATLRSGDLVVYSPDSAYGPRVTSWDDSLRFSAVALSPDTVSAACAAVGIDPARVHHLDRFPTSDGGASDGLLAALVRELSAHLHQGDVGDPLYTETLSYAIAAHLVYAHTAESAAPPVFRGGVTERQRRRVEDAVRADLTAQHSLEGLAALVGLSPFHFAREFKWTTGETVHGFVRRLRTDHAARLLRETTRLVSEIASDVGYSSPSRFASAFRKARGRAPLAYRRA